MQRLKKFLSWTIAISVIATSVMPAFAIKNVKFTDNGDGTATVTAEDTNRIAVAQYDKLGFIKGMGISKIVNGKHEVMIDYDKTLSPVKVISFSDIDNLITDNKAHNIGQKTRIYADFDNAGEGSYILNKLGYEIDNNFETADCDGNITKALLMRGTTDGVTPFNIQFGGAYSEDSDCVVYEYDMKLNDLNTKFISYIKAVKQDGSAGAWQTLWSVSPDDAQSETIEFGATKVSAKTIQKDKWYRLSAIVDYNLETIKFYMDKVYLGEEAINSNINTKDNFPDIFYIQGPLPGSTDFVVDNVRVYEGTEPRDTIDKISVNINTAMPTVVDPDETEARQILNGKYVVHTRSGVAIDKNGNKTLMNNTPYIESDKVYIHLEEICKAWGITAPTGVSANGKGYVPLEDLADAMGVNIYTPETVKNSGIAVLANEFTAPADIQSLNNYAFYMRATDDAVLELYNNSATKGVHPRLFATQSDFDRMRAMYEDGTDAVFMKWAVQLIDFADSRLSKEPPELEEMSSSGRTLQRKLKGDVYSWAMAYHLTGDMKYVERTVQELKYFCDFPNWYPQDHLHIIETMDAFSIAYDWLFNVISDDDKKLFEENMYEEGFLPSYQAFRNKASAMGNAFYASNNHGTVCNGGMAMAAAAFMDIYPEECAWFLSGTMKGMEFNIDKWYTGAWYEGAGYWEYAMAYTVKFIESLRGTIGTDFGFGKLEGLDITAEEEIGMHGSRGIYNYADAGLGKYYSPEMMWLGSEFNNSRVATKVVKEYKDSFPQNHRTKGESYAIALLWYNPEMIGEDATFNNDNFYEELDVITMREGWDSTDTFVGIKAGVLKEAHSQLDSGSFIFESDGIRWLQDFGAGSYEEGYFESNSGGKRWRSIQARAEGHSTVSVNPGGVEDMNVGNSGAFADMNLIESNDKGAIVTVDMTQVLFDTGKGTRGFFFTDNRQSLVVRDEISLESSKALVNETFDGKTTTNTLGTFDSNYTLVSGAGYGLDANDTVAKLTGYNRYLNDNPWGATTGTKNATFEFDLYVEDKGAKFQFYPVAKNRYGVQVSNGNVYILTPDWATETTNKTITVGKWHHFAVEYKMEDGLMIVYMDNNPIYTQTGLDTNSNAPMDHYFNGEGRGGKYVLVNNIKCHTGLIDPKEDVVYWRLIPDNNAEVSVDANTNTITMTKDGKKCFVEYQVEGGTVVEEKFEKPIVSIIDNARPISDKYGRVVLKITGVTGDVKITAKITPESATNVTPLSDYVKAISEWKLN